MTNYYNEFDPKAAAWIRELIKMKMIPEGVVDERSICDVLPAELVGYEQCHFFAGIGGWSRALQLAGFSGKIWTGSCPCQSFSTAGKQLGFGDPRDLWPVFFRLIRECRPEIVVGEQVEAAIRHGWLDRLQGDLEGEGYAVGAVVLGAHSVQSPHIRQRLYWGASRLDVSQGEGRRGRKQRGDEELGGSGTDWTGGLADMLQPGLEGFAGDGRESDEPGRLELRYEHRDGGGDAFAPVKCNEYDGLGDSEGRKDDLGGRGGLAGTQPQRRCIDHAADIAGADGGLERDIRNGKSDWQSAGPVWCRDGVYRLVPDPKSGIFPLAYGLPRGMVHGCDPLDPQCANKTQEGRAVRLKGYGNAIVPQVAAEFIRAFMG